MSTRPEGFLDLDKILLVFQDAADAPNISSHCVGVCVETSLLMLSMLLCHCWWLTLPFYCLFEWRCLGGDFIVDVINVVVSLFMVDIAILFFVYSF